MHEIKRNVASFTMMLIVMNAIQEVCDFTISFELSLSSIIRNVVLFIFASILGDTLISVIKEGNNND